MRFLLDTHVLLWWLEDTPALTKDGKALIVNPENMIFVSAVSIWEIRIKQSLGKLNIPDDFETALEREHFEALPITHKHAHAVTGLAPVHRDPFDRMLVAQALQEDLTILSHDDVFRKYEASCILI